MTARRLPRWSEVRPLIGTGRPTLDALARANTIEDLRTIARRRTPRAVFDYVDGAAEAEISRARSDQAYRDVEFHPRVLRDVTTVDTSRIILGRKASLPLVLAPTGFTRMMHHEGEPSVYRAAAAAGVPYTLSTMGTTSVEDLAGAADGRRWFQLYLWNDRAASKDLVERAKDSGYDTLVVTVDVAVPGARMRDVRNGLTIPPQLRLRTLADMALHPSWWFNLLTTEPLEFASFRSFDGGAYPPHRLRRPPSPGVAELIGSLFDPSVTLTDLEDLRQQWPHHLVVKGIQHAADAVAVVDRGADAVVVSNHGGRQLDRTVTPLRILPEVVAAVAGRAEVFVDGGIMRGSDLVAAVGLGATAGLIGRGYLYGLMAGGQRGVTHAIDIIGAETRRTLQLLGAPSIAAVGPEHVRLVG